MQHPTVKSLFQEELEHYADPKQATDSYLISRIFRWFLKRHNRNISVCEFGGAAGQLLSVIAGRYPNAKFINAEIVPEYQDRLVSKKITFQLRSILDSGFADRSFDVIIIRDVLHHLIGANYLETALNQHIAIKELKRLIRPGGAIFIEELTSGSKVISRIIYELTKVNARIGIRIPTFSISPNVIVSFMSSQELIKKCENEFGVDYVQKETIPIKMGIAYHLAHFGDRVAKVVLIIQQ